MLVFLTDPFDLLLLVIDSVDSFFWREGMLSGFDYWSKLELFCESFNYGTL